MVLETLDKFECFLEEEELVYWAKKEHCWYTVLRQLEERNALIGLRSVYQEINDEEMKHNVSRKLIDKE